MRDDSAPVPAPGPAPIRVLLAEDIETNRAVVVSMLARLGVVCDVAEDGVQALAAASAADYDLILMDLNMPELDGYDATKAIRALPGARGQVPIVACTANAFPDDVARCLAAGMDGHIAKPVRLRQLAEELEKYLPGRTLDLPLPLPQGR